jgi:two-component system sensor histidine kinase KdpD
VVVGFVETHGRSETEAQLGDLEIVPRTVVPYRGVTIEEMDTAAILARKPEIVLVDELAHTNPPGSPREKRFADVEVLRNAGIDVISTLNVQHLESLHDVVAGITGVDVRETIPDRALEDADVQLVDLPPDALIERLRQGKVYPPQRAQQALQHYFRPGNLTALREMALRHTAAGVEEDLSDYMHEHRIEDVWPASDRVLVLVDGEDASGVVLRNAWRLASALRSEMVALVILPTGESGNTASEDPAMRKNIMLAEDLGARLVTLSSQDTVQAIVTTVREERATLIVMRHVPHAGWRRFGGRPLVDDLLDRLDNVDIYLVETTPKREA